VSGKPFLLGFGEAVVAEASLVLQVEDECPDLGGAYLCSICGQPFGFEESLQIGDATGDDGYRLVALPLGFCEKSIALY